MNALSIVASCFLASMILQIASASEGDSLSSGEHSMSVDGRARLFLVQVPDQESPPAGFPVVMVLHGGGGQAKSMQNLFRLDGLAEEVGFITVYPQGVERHWNDGRESRIFRNHHRVVDDVAFIRALVRYLCQHSAVDPSRIFATGPSNGGMMSHRLGIECSDLFAGIAPMIGGIPVGMEQQTPRFPVSVLMVQGTADELVPFDGGPISLARAFGLPANTRRGAVLSTDDALAFWRDHNQVSGEPVITDLPNSRPKDGVRCRQLDWPPADDGTRIRLVKMIGAGHTVPGMVQYAPRSLIGNTCYDVEAAELIWSFFKDCPPRQPIKPVATRNAD